MKRISLLLALIIMAVSCMMTFGGVIANAASSNIAMISTNPGEDSSTSMNVGFHATLGYTSCKVQYTTQDDTSWSKAKWQTGTYETYGANSSSNPFYGKSTKSNTGSTITQTPTFLDYSVTLSGLTPNTKYMYRIYDGSAYSDTYKFKTAGAESWSFVVTGDFHQYYDGYGVNRVGNGTKAVNAAISLASQLNEPEVGQIVSIGDVVAWGYTYTQWQSVLNQPYMKEYPYINANGNHDGMDSNASGYTVSHKYNTIVHNFPKNGYSGQVGNCFWYLYNYVLFITVDFNENTSTAVNWAKSVCDKNKGLYKYIILVNHVSAISKYNAGLNTSYFWNNWHGFCDQYHVDLVLTGDHHVYMRSKPLYNEQVVSNYSASNPDATVYLTNDSTDGERGSSTDVSSKIGTTSYLASHYFRYEVSGSTADISSVLVNVTPTKITTRFVYYENKSGYTGSASSSFYQGAVNGHSNFYYGDTAYVYPSDHGFTGTITPPDDPPGPIDPPDPGELPLAKTKFLLKSNGGTYKYTASNYAGRGYEDTSAYTANYIDTAVDGGYVKDTYTSGELNDGTLMSAATPASSSPGYAVWLGGKTPEIYCQLSDINYIAQISVYYIKDSSGTLYGDSEISQIMLGESDSSLSATTDYTVETSDQATSGSKTLVKLTAKFTKAFCAKNLYLMLSPQSGTTRTGICELEVWGESLDGDKFSVKDEYKGKVSIDEDKGFIYQQSFKKITKADFLKTVEGSNIIVKDQNGEKIAEDSAVITTGCSAIARSSTGRVVQELFIVIRGDVTGDSKFTTSDYIAIKRVLAGKYNAEGAYYQAADADGDGTVTANDYAKIKAFFKGNA